MFLRLRAGAAFGMADTANTLIVFVKEPHQAKHRLRSDFPGAFVNQLAAAFLRDTLEMAARVDGAAVRIAFAPRSAEPQLRPYVESVAWEKPCRLWRQRGRALGTRLEAAFKSAFDEGARRVIAIGSDSPSLSADTVTAGFDLLAGCDCVLGPALDGGYYLVGLSLPRFSVFQDIDWTQATIYRDTVNVLEREGLSHRELPLWYDVDEAGDLEFLVRDINQFRLEGDEVRARHSEAVLARLLEVDT